jgi:uncharacterized protein (TIGR02117 family)
LEIGWGDRGFYQANEITSKLTMNAIFWPSEAVLHVVAIPDEPAKVFKNSEIKSIHLGKTQYALFLEYLVRSFKKENDKIILLSKGIYGDSRFFLGEGRYYLFNTCNKWTAKGLKSAQYNISTPFKLTAGSVMDSIAQ